jgi:Protein of unknown function (DUF2892)
MTRNLGSVDRALRALFGALALLGAFVFGWSLDWMIWAATMVGVILRVTAAAGT